MPKNSEEDLIVGLDIGTSKVLAIVAQFLADDRIEIIGVGHYPSRGLRKGVVANIESTVQSIQRAVEEAEVMADCDIQSAYVGISGAHIGALSSHGVVAVRDNEVSHEDIERVTEAARALAIPNDQRILHILPQDFVIDGQDGIRNPVGMSGVRLECKVHIITSASSATQNVIKCVRRCGLNADDVILQPLASSYAVLDNDEKELGVCLIDIGGGTTDIAVFIEGTIRHIAVLPVAGDQITNDIAVALRTPTSAAEEIKKKFGCALAQLAQDNELIDTPSVGDRAPRQLSRSTLTDVIEPRVEELFILVQAEIRRSGFEELLGAGVVLTGGSAKMEGMVELAEEVFHMPVRVAAPQYVGHLSEVVRSPIFSTAVGLVLFGRRHRSETPAKKEISNGRFLKWIERVTGRFRHYLGRGHTSATDR
jgi:cell division protein FtsA